jgi:sterol desaturase/sphingolipid hydroxylase (fatty acid hydroxylase superfamily)
MHQIHHSLDKRHFNKNYSQVFSLWDWLLGTIYVPREKEMLNFGLTDFEHKSYDSVWKLYSLPFKKSFAWMKGRLVAAAGIAFSEKKDDERTNISSQ